MWVLSLNWIEYGEDEAGIETGLHSISRTYDFSVDYKNGRSLNVRDNLGWNLAASADFLTASEVIRAFCPHSTTTRLETAAPRSQPICSPPESIGCKSPLSNEAYGSVVLYSGCCGASALTRSRTKYNCTGNGCSLHSVPSLSKVAIRSATGTRSGEPELVILSTKLMMDCFAGPSFHDGRESAACEATAVK